MRTLFGTTVFTVENEPYYWEDVVLAGLLSGEWADLERDVRHGFACLERAREIGAGLTSEQVEAAATEFRYERDLISAQETREWLARWELTAEQWLEYIRRVVLRTRWARELAELTGRYPASDAEVDRCLKCEAVCSGRLGRLAHALANRAAVAASHAVQPRSERDRGCDTENVDALFGRVGDAAARVGLDSNRCRARLEALARLESSFGRFRTEVLTTKAIEEQISAHRLEWLRFDCRSVAFSDEAAAREAALCVRADGSTLSDVALAARKTAHAQRFYLDDVERSVRERLLGAAEGDLVGPIAADGEFILLHVVRKEAPSGGDLDTRRRAEESVLRRALARARTERIQWQKQV